MPDIYEVEDNYRPKPDDRRLIEEFRKNPIGHHSPDLQRLLNRLRSGPMADKYCLVVIKPSREWQLAKTSGVPGKPLKMLSQRFTRMDDAEWYVFRQRWKALTGETLR
ncbi:MAG: ABC transporter permease [Alphaproteobacteria bacterium]|jgi:N,N-dimethylformamidase|nr:ABC transporter permease [Alphaproteobacteria bacterium]